MAFRKTLAQRFFNISKLTSPNALCNCRISSPSTAVKSLSSANPHKSAPDPGDDGMFRRFLHRRPAYHPELWSLPAGESLLEKLRGMDISKDRIRLDGLRPPTTVAVVRDELENKVVAVDDVRKLLKLSLLEMVKLKLRQLERSWISHDEFVNLCSDTSFSKELGMEVAKMLDQSGTVIVLGNAVFIRPEQVMKAVQGLMPVPIDQPDVAILEELEEMEKQKAVIDKKAESLVRRELWCGLGYLIIQTAAFMRLTFWELSWDVMEPICFYVTSMYFMAGYAFFLRTSKEPSFEGFFQNRFSAKQKRLMKLHNFNIDKYNELRRACYPDALPAAPGNSISLTTTSKFGNVLHEHNAVR